MSKRRNKNIFSCDNQILSIRTCLKRKIMCSERKWNHDIQDHLDILDLIKCTIEMGESNSILLIGPRGSGKTTLIDSVLRELSHTQNYKENFITVNLHGLVHIDDRLALKDMARQMQMENVVGDKVFGTFAENLIFLIDSLKSGNKRSSKPVIFILDEFDLFCSHHNQTLLYNLFDVSQSAQAPICIVGVTCRLDVIELLEKRVKSRFSHRQIFLYPSQISSLASTVFDNQLEHFQDILSLANHEKMEEIGTLYQLDSFLAHWNDQIKNLKRNSKVVSILKKIHKNDRSDIKFGNFLAAVVSVLCSTYQELTVNDFADTNKIFSHSEKLSILEGLSILEICLVIAMKHETEINDGEPLNFEKVWSRYLKFVDKNASIGTVQRPIVLKAFEHIKSLELIAPTGLNQKIEKEYQSFKFSLMSQQVLNAVKNCQGLPTDVTQWADSSII